MMKELREQMLVDLQLSGATTSTQKNYLREVGNLTKYFNRIDPFGETCAPAYGQYRYKWVNKAPFSPVCR